MIDDFYRVVGACARSLSGVPVQTVVSVWLASAVLTLWAHWKIVSRAGYGGCWSLMLLVPCLNLFFLAGFAWSRWPVQGSKK